MGLEWLWSAIAAALATAAVGGVGMLVRRSGKSYADDAVNVAVEPIKDRLTKIERDLAVAAERETERSKHLEKLSNDMRRLVRGFHALQIALAKKLGLSIEPEDDGNDE